MQLLIITENVNMSNKIHDRDNYNLRGSRFEVSFFSGGELQPSLS